MNHFNPSKIPGLINELGAEQIKGQMASFLNSADSNLASDEHVRGLLAAALNIMQEQEQELTRHKEISNKLNEAAITGHKYVWDKMHANAAANEFEIDEGTYNDNNRISRAIKAYKDSRIPPEPKQHGQSADQTA